MTATIFFFMLALHCVCIGTFKKLLHTFQFIEFQALFLTPAVLTRTRISTTAKKKKKKLGKNFSTQLEFFCWCTLKLLSSQSKIPLFTFSVSYLAIFFFFFWRAVFYSPPFEGSDWRKSATCLSAAKNKKEFLQHLNVTVASEWRALKTITLAASSLL